MKRIKQIPYHIKAINGKHIANEKDKWLQEVEKYISNLGNKFISISFTEIILHNAFGGTAFILYESKISESEYNKLRP